MQRRGRDQDIKSRPAQIHQTRLLVVVCGNVSQFIKRDCVVVIIFQHVITKVDIIIVVGEVAKDFVWK